MPDAPAADRIEEVRASLPQELHLGDNPQSGVLFEVRQRNADRADDVVAALLAAGIADVFVCPGSRSTPLVFALERHGMRTRVFFDERVAGFAAVGAARVGRPTAVLTTSGTAVANLLPAACEADADELPWVALSADRPRSMIDTGANQTLNQPPLLRGPARGVCDLDAVSETAHSRADDAADLRQILSHLTGAARGPVHLNVRFSKPLEPAATHQVTSSALPVSPVDVHRDDDSNVRRLVPIIGGAVRGLIIVGGLHAADREAARGVINAIGWDAAIVDVTSGLRRRSLSTIPTVALRSPQVTAALQPDVVVWIGGALSEETIQRWLGSLPSTTTVVQLKSGARCRDAEQRMDLVITAPSSSWSALTLTTKTPSALRAVATSLTAATSRATATTLAGSCLSEPVIAREVLGSVRAGEVLLIGNSMPVRDADRFADLGCDDVDVLCNRGVSGIDGTIATALGACLVSGKPATAFVGDLAFLHDLGGVVATMHSQAPLRIVVVNNGGGGIFSFLPVAGASAAIVERYFDTPHSFALAPIAASMGMAAHVVDNLDELRARLREPPRHPEVLEVRTVRSDNVLVHQQLDTAIADACADALGLHRKPGHQ